MTDVMEELVALDRIEVGTPAQEDLLRRVDSRRRRRRTLEGGGALALVAILAALVVALQSGPVAPEQVEAAARLTLPGRVVDTAQAKDRLWVLTCQSRCATSGARASLVGVNDSGKIESVAAVAGAQAVAVGDGSAWIANFAGSSVERVDPESGEVIATIPLSIPKAVAPGDFSFVPFEIQFGAGSVWVESGRGYVARIDPAQNAVVATYQVPPVPGPLLVAGNRVLLSGGMEGLVEIDPANGGVSTVPVEGSDGKRLSITGLTSLEGEVWASGMWAKPVEERGGHRAFVITQEAALLRVGLSGPVSKPVSIPKELVVQAGAGGNLFLAREPRASSVYVYRPGSARVEKLLHLRQGGTVVGAHGRSLWVGLPRQVLALYKVNYPAGR